MKKRRTIFFIFVVLFVSVVTSILILGCQREVANKKLIEKKPPAKTIETPQKETTPVEKEEKKEGLIEVTVYFPDTMAQKLLPEIRKISSTDNTAEAALKELFSGPKEKDKLPVIPSGLKVPVVTIEGDTANVNFSRELYNLHPRGSTGENMFIFAITNTLTDSVGVKKVRFLIEGKPADIAGSNYDLKTQVFERNSDIIGK